MTVDIDSVRLLTDSIKAATERKPDGSTVSATVTEAGSNIIWVRIDGSSGTTPVTQSTVSVSVGDRVSVRIENGSATITGNLSNVSTGAAETRAAVEPVKAVAESAEQAAERATDYASTAKNAAQSAVQSAADAGRAAAVAQAAMGSTTVDWHDYRVEVGDDGQWHAFDKDGVEVPLSEISMVYQDALGLHILGDRKRIDISGEAVEIFDTSEDGRSLARFADETIIGNIESGFMRLASTGFDVTTVTPGEEWSNVGVTYNGVGFSYTATADCVVKFSGTGNNWYNATDVDGLRIVSLPNGAVHGTIEWTYNLKAGQTISVLAAGPAFDTASLVHAVSNYSATPTLSYADSVLGISNGKAETGYDTGTFVKRSGIVDGFTRQVGFIVGSGGKNAGVWDSNLGKWLIYSNGTTDTTYLHGANATVNSAGYIGAAGGYKVNGNPLLKVEKVTDSARSVGASTSTSWNVTLPTINGYTPIGVVGFNNAGTSSTSMIPIRHRISGQSLYFAVRNASSTATSNLVYDYHILYAANGVL